MFDDTSSLTKEQRTEISGPVLRRFIRACASWQICLRDEMSLAGYPPEEMYLSWTESARKRKSLRLEENTILRMGAVTAAQDHMSRRLPCLCDQLDWLHNPNRGPACRGMSPFEVLSHPNIALPLQLRHHLDRWSSLPQLKGVQIIKVSSNTLNLPTNSR